MIELETHTPVMDQTWTSLVELEDAFSQISTFNFMLEQLQDAVDHENKEAIVDITAALNAFYPVFCDNWDKKYQNVCEHVKKGGSHEFAS